MQKYILFLLPQVFNQLFSSFFSFLNYTHFFFEIHSLLVYSFFILFREGFEALLISILVFTYLDKVNARHQRPAVIWGLIAGVVVSLLTALAVKKIAAITHAHQELFEGSVMLIASGMLAYVAYFSHSAKQHVEGKVDKAVSTGNPFFLSLTVFFAIIREGFEVVLFYAALFTSTIYSTIPVIAGAITGTLALVFVYFGQERIMAAFQSIGSESYQELLYLVFVFILVLVAIFSFLRKYSIIPIIGAMCCLYLMIEIPPVSWLWFLYGWE